VLGDIAPCGAEIDQYRRSVTADDDVVRRDVAVKKIGRVEEGQRVQQRRYDTIELVLARRAAEALEPGLEALAILVLQDNEPRVRLAEEAIDADDVRVIEAGQRARLVKKALEAPLVVTGAVLGAGLRGLVVIAHREIDREVLLDRHHPGERYFLGKVGDAEAAGAQDTLDAIVLCEARACWQGGKIRHLRRRRARKRSPPPRSWRVLDLAHPVPVVALTDSRLRVGRHETRSGDRIPPASGHTATMIYRQQCGGSAGQSSDLLSFSSPEDEQAIQHAFRRCALISCLTLGCCRISQE